MGLPGLADDPLYATHAARGEVQAQLDGLIAGWTQGLKADDILARLNANGVPAGRIYRAPEMLADPHFAARKAIIDVAHPLLGNIKMQGTFPQLSKTPGNVRWTGPALGEHNEEVWGGLVGLKTTEIADLEARGLI